MPIINLMAGIESLQNTLDKTVSKRKEWSTRVIPLVSDIFQKVIDEYKLGWTVEVAGKVKYGESVSLSIGSVDSGISHTNPDGLKMYKKFGGALSFVLLYNGDVEVQILLPYIDKVAGLEGGFKTIRKVAPEDIDEEFVYLQVGKMITEINAWEAGTSEEKLG